MRKLLCFLTFLFFSLSSYAVDPSGSHYTDGDSSNWLVDILVYIVILIGLPLVSIVLIDVGNKKDEATGKSDNSGTLGWTGIIVWSIIILCMLNKCSQ